MTATHIAQAETERIQDYLDVTPLEIDAMIDALSEFIAEKARLESENEAQRDLIVRALNLRIRYLQLDGFKVPTWIAAQDVFGGNVDAARAICHRHGFDPDREIGEDE